MGLRKSKFAATNVTVIFQRKSVGW